jgi:predicted ester cyclase
MEPGRLQAIFTGWLVQAAGGGDIIETVEQLMAPDCVVHLQNGVTGGVEVSRLQMEASRTAFPDLTMEIERVLYHDDTIVIQLILTGTHSGWLGPWAPTGRRLRSTGAFVLRVNDAGEIVEMWPYIGLGAPLMFPPEPAD